jgi:hypothetical protein
MFNVVLHQYKQIHNISKPYLQNKRNQLQIIIKTNAQLPQIYVTLADFGCPVYVHWFYCSQRLLKILKLFGFQISLP